MCAQIESLHYLLKKFVWRYSYQESSERLLLSGQSLKPIAAQLLDRFSEFTTPTVKIALKYRKLWEKSRCFWQRKNPSKPCGSKGFSWWRLLDSNCRAYLSSIHTYSQKPLFATVSGASFWHLFTTEAIKNTSLKGKNKGNRLQLYMKKP